MKCEILKKNLTSQIEVHDFHECIFEVQEIIIFFVKVEQLLFRVNLTKCRQLLKLSEHLKSFNLVEKQTLKVV